MKRENMKKEELLEIVKKEANKLEGKVYSGFMSKKDKDGKLHTWGEIRIMEDGALLNRGFKLSKQKDKIHNAELFDEIIERIMTTIFAVDKKGFLTIAMKKLSYKKYDFDFEVKPFNKKLKFYINGKIVFTLRKIKKQDGKYVISQSAVFKAFDTLERELVLRFRTTIEDFKTCKDLIESMANYLMVI